MRRREEIGREGVHQGKWVLRTDKCAVLSLFESFLCGKEQSSFLGIFFIVIFYPLYLTELPTDVEASLECGHPSLGQATIARSYFLSLGQATIARSYFL